MFLTRGMNAICHCCKMLNGMFLCINPFFFHKNNLSLLGKLVKQHFSVIIMLLLLLLFTCILVAFSISIQDQILIMIFSVPT